MFQMLQGRRKGFFGKDKYTKLLLHCNGADTTTDFPDSSRGAHVVTASGNAQVDVAQSVFGGASGLFDGTGDYLTVPDHADWYLGSGNLTIDCRFRLNALTAGTRFGFFHQRVSADNNIAAAFYKEAGAPFTQHVQLYVEEATVLKIAGPFTVNSITTNTWYHIAFIRGWGGVANRWAITIDGVSAGTEDITINCPNFAANLEIGRYHDNVAYRYLNGWIDEYRVSKGIARWTANFTPPTKAYR